MKKFLSLVMALVLALSLVTISAGATDYDDLTDKGSITYNEAVAVMNGLGIISGYTDGSFKPTGTLTRGAAAKIIAYLNLGTKAAAALTCDSAPYPDVKTTDTFAPFIAYCKNAKLIDGYADGTFKAGNSLTGYQFAKMLLTSLGYDSAIEQFTGSNWAVNVATIAVELGLFDGNDAFVGTQVVTREEACLYAFNTLQANTVKYTSKGTTITVNGIEIVTGASDATDVTTNSSDSYNQDDDGIVQFCEKNFSKLELDPTSDDAFGSPAHKWTYDDDVIGTYADDADDTYVVTKADLSITDVLTGSNYMDYDTSDLAMTSSAYSGTFKENYDVVTDPDDYISVIGDIVETFDTNDDDVIDSVIVRQYTAAKIDDVETDLSSTLTKNGATYELDVTSLNGNTDYGTYYDAYKNNDGVLPGYTDDYTEGTVLAVALNNSSEVLDSYVADTITGDVTSYKASSYAYIGGVKYTFGTVDGSISSFSFDSGYNFYLSAEGYVIGVEGASAAKINDVYYVTGVYMTTSSMGTTTFYAQTVSLDGTVGTQKLEQAAFEDLSETTLAGDTAEADTLYDTNAGLYTFSDKSADADGTTAGNGKYMALAWNGGSDYVTDNDELADSITKSATRLYLDTDKYYVTSSTQYLAVESSGDDIDVSTATGGMKAAAATSTFVICDTDDDDVALYVIYVGADLSSTVTSDDVVYLASQPTVVNGDDTYEATLYFMDGLTSQTVTLDTDYAAGFYTYDIDDDDVYTLSDVSPITDAVDSDDTDGSATFLTIDSVYNNGLTGTAANEASGTTVTDATFEDISFADALIVDNRSDDDKDADVYSSAITSASKLTTAVGKGDVTIDVFMNDGEITFVCVQTVENA